MERIETEIRQKFGGEIPNYTVGIHTFLINNAQFYNPNTNGADIYLALAQKAVGHLRQIPPTEGVNFYTATDAERTITLGDGTQKVLTETEISDLLLYGLVVSMQKVINVPEEAEEKFKTIPEAFQARAVTYALRRDNYAQAAFDIDGYTDMLLEQDFFDLVASSPDMVAFLVHRGFDDLKMMVQLATDIKKFLGSDLVRDHKEKLIPQAEFDTMKLRLKVLTPNFAKLTREELAEWKEISSKTDQRGNLELAVRRFFIFNQVYSDQNAASRALVIKRLALPQDLPFIERNDEGNLNLAKIDDIMLNIMVDHFLEMTRISDYILTYQPE